MVRVRGANASILHSTASIAASRSFDTVQPPYNQRMQPPVSPSAYTNNAYTASAHPYLAAQHNYQPGPGQRMAAAHQQTAYPYTQCTPQQPQPPQRFAQQPPSSSRPPPAPLQSMPTHTSTALLLASQPTLRIATRRTTSLHCPRQCIHAQGLLDIMSLVNNQGLRRIASLLLLLLAASIIARQVSIDAQQGFRRPSQEHPGRLPSRSRVWRICWHELASRSQLAAQGAIGAVPGAFPRPRSRLRRRTRPMPLLSAPP